MLKAHKVDEVYNVCVLIGDEAFHVEISDHHTCGWLLSEAMRLFMDANNDEDPGLLGLKILEDGRDLDLGGDVIDSVHEGETVLGVSYTVKRTGKPIHIWTKATLRGARIKKNERESRPPTRMEEALSKANAALAVPQLALEKLRGKVKGTSMNYMADYEVETLKELYNAATKSTLVARKANALFGRAKELQAMIKQNRTLLGKEIHHVFTPLPSFVKAVQVHKEEQRFDAARSRTSTEHGASADTRTFLMKTIKDPSGELPVTISFVVGPTRLSIVDTDTLQFFYDWKYTSISSWGDTGQYFFIQILKPKTTRNVTEIKEKGSSSVFAWRFEFDVMEGASADDVLSALFQRCSQIVHINKEKSNAYKHLNVLLPEGAMKETLRNFKVDRLDDPSGTLPTTIALHIGRQRLMVVDTSINDVIYEWPYTYIIAWRVDYGEIGLTVYDVTKSEETMNFVFGTHRSWHIKYCIEKSINDILRFNGEPELPVGEDIPTDELDSITHDYKKYVLSLEEENAGYTDDDSSSSSYDSDSSEDSDTSPEEENEQSTSSQECLDKSSNKEDGNNTTNEVHEEEVVLDMMSNSGFREGISKELKLKTRHIDDDSSNENSDKEPVIYKFEGGFTREAKKKKKKNTKANEVNVDKKVNEEEINLDKKVKKEETSDDKLMTLTLPSSKKKKKKKKKKYKGKLSLVEKEESVVNECLIDFGNFETA